MKDYQDIINLPHFRSAKHPHMSISDRAAQFAPFAALNGYGDAVDEAGRLTEERLQLSEEQLCELDEKLAALAPLAASGPQVCVTYFCADARKQGGAYLTLSGRLRKIDGYKKILYFQNGAAVSFADIVNIE